MAHAKDTAGPSGVTNGPPAPESSGTAKLSAPVAGARCSRCGEVIRPARGGPMQDQDHADRDSCIRYLGEVVAKLTAAPRMS
ncbi:hypothetical protein AKJ09_05820 [Labilithrix luteola]|uniref:Uncharacterized protein n=1 Tax=Labilithrix luteola TaxID=1391654 RepID=A0A0K1Q0I9_9BACT|nr:hypothetical protein [Labilithrix luteola]AKU99156.1 hypothetical protein AKJ09_05820 [Labilithrix luteola]